MTAIRVSLVDLYVVRGDGAGLECLVLRRGPRGRCAGSWETVHGHIEGSERPVEAALRELAEETGLAPRKLYSLSRVESFYLHRTDEVALVPVFVAFVDTDARIRLSDEHDTAEWLRPDEAARRFAWPRERRAMGDIVQMLGAGHAGPLEDVLQIC